MRRSGVILVAVVLFLLVVLKFIGGFSWNDLIFPKRNHMSKNLVSCQIFYFKSIFIILKIILVYNKEKKGGVRCLK